MKNLKQEALNAISTLPESAQLDEIMYRLYVIDQVEKGRVDVEQGRLLVTEKLEKEIESW